MKIGEVSKLIKINITALRYYDEIGLVKPNRINGIRDYSSKDIERLEFLSMLQKINFSLEEIKVFFDFDDKYNSEEKVYAMPKEDQVKIKLLLKDKILKIEDQLNEMNQAKGKLEKMYKKITTLDQKEDK